MKVFLSSVISGFESYRDQAASAVTSLGYEVVRAEDFGATTSSPQQACLAGVREADVTILLLGERYGAEQPSGLSATHEEYQEAQGRQPVLIFVQEQVDYEAAQAEFIRDVREWETGNLTVSFATEDDLRSAVTRELHRYAVSAASGSVDERELLSLAEERVDAPNVSKLFGGKPEVVLSLAAAPRREILRPSELEGASLAQELHKEALFGAHPLFAIEAGASTTLRSDWLVLSQQRASVELNSLGDIVTRQSAVAADRGLIEIPTLIEEDVRDSLAVALKLSAAILDHIDSLKRLSHTVTVAALTEVGGQAWRTREEHAPQPELGGHRAEQGSRGSTSQSRSPDPRRIQSTRRRTGTRPHGPAPTRVEAVNGQE